MLLNQASRTLTNEESNGSRRSARIRESFENLVIEDDDECQDLSSLFKNVMEFEKGVERDETAAVAMASFDVTKKHHARSNKLENSFISALLSVVNTNGEPKWGKLLKDTPNPNHVPG